MRIRRRLRHQPEPRFCEAFDVRSIAETLRYGCAEQGVDGCLDLDENGVDRRGILTVSREEQRNAAERGRLTSRVDAGPRRVPRRPMTGRLIVLRD